MFSRVAAVLAAVLLVHMAAGSITGRSLEGPPDHYHQVTMTFDGQMIDHFNVTDQRTYSQRVFYIDQYYTNPVVLLHICGEYTCPGIMGARLWPLEIAQQLGAMVVSVEHRFFGESLPFPTATTDELRFHTSRQALADLAHFTPWFEKWVRTNYPHVHAPTFKWMNVGGSYPGALSAWYRLKYPHLTELALSSSGVVNAMVEFPQFDEQVARSAGESCANLLREITGKFEEALKTDNNGTKALLDAEHLSDGDFFYLIADSAAESVQYGHRVAMCSFLEDEKKKGSNMLDAFVQYTKTVFYGQMGSSPDDYALSSIDDPAKPNNGRSWWWQKCNEVAWFQIAPKTGAIRSQEVNMAYHEARCKAAFGNDIAWPPNVDATNEYYGAAGISGFHIFFVNGGEDPWQWAGVRHSPNQKTEPAYIATCTDCGHCVDLYTPTDDDAQVLKNIRAQQVAKIQEWMGATAAQ